MGSNMERVWVHPGAEIQEEGDGTVGGHGPSHRSQEHSSRLPLVSSATPGSMIPPWPLQIQEI